MPIFILLSTLSQQGVQTIKSNPERLRAETLENIERWNELGRSLCASFLETAGV